MKKKYFSYLIIFSLTILSCGGSGDSDDNNEITETTAYDRAEMLKHWADNIIVPSYNSFFSYLNILDNKTKIFLASPNQSNMNDLRVAWLNSYKSWQHVEMFDIGKAEEIYYKSKMNIYPVDKAWLENSVSTGNYDLDNANSYSSQGMPALDYLLNGVGVSDNDIITKYTANNKYKDYLTAVVAKMLSNTKTVVDDWSTYKASFISSTANTSTSSANKLINDFIYYYEKGFRANKVGIPAGIFSGSPLPGNVEAFYKKDVSRTLMLEAMNSIINFYNGTSFDGMSTGPSLKGYLAHLNTSKSGISLSSTLINKLESAKSKINELPNNFVNQINSDNSKMLLTYDAIQSVVVLLKVDMLQAFNINVDYQDADGD